MIEHNKLKFFKVGWQKTLHIIGAGPSLRGFDFNSLKQEAVMTLNSSIYHLPIKPDYHVYCEPVAKEREHYSKMNAFQRVKKFSIHDYPEWSHIAPFPGIENLAFQIAILLGKEMNYKEIHLYGYDFSFIDGWIYWWDEQQRNMEDVQDKLIILNKQKIIFDNFIKNISNIIIHTKEE